MLSYLASFLTPGPSVPLAAPPVPPALPPPPEVGQRRDSLYNPLSGLGSGTTDKGSAARPDVYALPLTRAELLALHRRNGYARRIVSLIPREGTRKGWKVDDSTAKANPMENEDQRLDTRARVRKAWDSARLLGGALILPVLDEEIPPDLAGLPPEQARRVLAKRPLDLSRVRSVRSLLVLGRSEANAASWDTDPQSPGYGSPRTWSVSPSRGGTSMEIHASRLLYFAGAPFPAGEDRVQDGYDDSVLEVCWDQVRNKSSIDQVSATVAQQLTISIYTMAGMAGAMTGDAATEISGMLASFSRMLGVSGMAVLRGGSKEILGDSFEVLNSPVSGFDTLDQAAKEALAAVSEIPMVVLFGQASGGLEGSGGEQRAGWHEKIASEQEAILREPLTKLYRMLYRAQTGPTGGVEPANWRVEFAPLDELTEQEQADLRKAYAEIDALNIEKGVYSAEHVAKSRYGEAGWSAEILPVVPAVPPIPGPLPTP